jgi:hypothetical protein
MTTPEQRQELQASFAAGKARVEQALAAMYDWHLLTDETARDRITHQRQIFDVAFNAGFEAARRALTEPD